MTYDVYELRNGTVEMVSKDTLPQGYRVIAQRVTKIGGHVQAYIAIPYEAKRFFIDTVLRKLYFEIGEGENVQAYLTSVQYDPMQYILLAYDNESIKANRFGAAFIVFANPDPNRYTTPMYAQLVIETIVNASQKFPAYQPTIDLTSDNARLVEGDNGEVDWVRDGKAA